MNEFEINGIKYRISKLDAFKQFHVTRKIAPIVPTLIPIFVRFTADKKLSDDIGALSELLGPFADGIAEMSDEASEYVIATCLGACQRSTGPNGWTAVWSKQANQCMFDDMDLGAIMQVVIKVVQDSLGPFIQGLLTSQQSNPTAEA